MAGRVVAGKGRAAGSSRVARLGSALDNVETRADEARGRGGRGVRASSGQRVRALCYATSKLDRMQISSIGEMTTTRLKGGGEICVSVEFETPLCALGMRRCSCKA